MGQVVTWLAPYKFSMDVPVDVDFRVMATFVDFYVTLLGFVNYRLFQSINLKYPPQVRQHRLQNVSSISPLMSSLSLD